MNRLFHVLCSAIAVAAMASASANAANYSWLSSGGSQNFLDPANWDPNWPGGADSNLRIDDNSDLTSPILTGDAGTINQLYIGSLTAGSTDAPYAGFTPQTTTGGKLTILEGGKLTVSGLLDVGLVGPVEGANTLALGGGAIVDGVSTGGQLISNSAFRLGALNNSATLEMSGGSRITHENGGEFTIGALSNGVGTANLHDYSVIAVYGTDFNIGVAGSGAPVQGTVNMYDFSNIGVSWGNHLHVGVGPGAVGNLNMSDNSSIGWFNSVIYVGQDGGTGTIQMTGSANIYQNYNSTYFGLGAGSVGNLIMTGDAITGAHPTINNLGNTYVGLDGATGNVEITDASYSNGAGFLRIGQGVGGVGTMTLTTTPGSLSPASLYVKSHLYVGYGAGQGELNIGEGSSVIVDGWVPVGHWDGGVPFTASGVVNMNGGTFTKTNVSGTYAAFGMGGTGVWNQNGGTTTINAPTVLGEANADTPGTGILNLNGGVYSTTRIYNGFSGTGNAMGRVNFDGGILKVNTTGFEFAPNGEFIMLRNAPDFIVSVKAGGATLDTNGGNIIIPVGFKEDPASVGGGFTKMGSGSLTWYGASTYTGATNVTDGNLILAKGASFATTQVAVSPYATLTVHSTAKFNAALDTATFGSNAHLAIILTATAVTAPIFDVTKAGSGVLNLADNAGFVNLSIIDGGDRSLATSCTLFQYNSSLGDSNNLLVMPNPAIRSLTVTPTTVTPPSGPSRIELAITYERKDLTWAGGWSNFWRISDDGMAWVSTGPEHFYSFDDVYFTDAGIAQKTAIIEGTVHPRDIYVNNSLGNDYTITDWAASTPGSTLGSITGIGTTLTKNGEGKLTINNAGGNDFTGEVTVNGGTLEFNGDNRLGSGNTINVNTGAILSNTVGWTIGSRTVNIDGGTVNVTGGVQFAGSTVNMTGDSRFNISAYAQNATGGLLDMQDTSELHFNAGGWSAEIGYGSPTDIKMSGDSKIEVADSMGFCVAMATGTGRLEMSGNSRIYAAGELRLGAYNGASGGAITTMDGNASIETGAFVKVGNNGGTGSLDVNGTSNVTTGTGMYIGSQGGSATVSVNDSGSIDVTGEMWVGVNNYTHDIETQLNIGGGTPTTTPAVVTVGSHLYFGFGNSVAKLDMTGTGELRLNPVGTGENEHLGWDGGSLAVITMSGNSKIISSNVYSDYAVGWLAIGDYGGTAHVTLNDDANITVPYARMKIGGSYGGVGGLGTMTLNDSATVDAGQLVTMNEENGPGQGILTLNGGVFSAPGIFGGINSQINFAGGALKATTSNADYLSGGGFTVSVGRNAVTDLGAIFDTGVYDVTISTPLVHAGAVQDGGLMKLGTGSLTLTGALGYDGNTTVNGGTLNLSDLNTPAATVFVADGAILTAHSIVADTLTIGGTGGGAAMATAVPEPGVFVLLAMAVLSAFLTWRRK